MKAPSAIIKPILLGWGLLISIPAYLLLSGTSLFPLIPLNSHLANGLFWLTSSGTFPYGVTTILVLLILSFKRLPRTKFICLFLTVGFSMCTTLALSHTLKHHFSENRPNITWLAQHQLLQDPQDFYAQPKAVRKQEMQQALSKLPQLESSLKQPLKLSPLIQQHWRHEVTYSFPSGHTLFAFTLTMIFSYFLLMAGRYDLPVLMFFWCIGIQMSRLLLGMHWSQDILASSIIGGFIGLFSLVVARYLFPVLQERLQKRFPRLLS